MLKAKAQAEATRLRGEAEAAATRARIEAAGSAENYIRQIDAQAKLQWKGDVPQFVVGGGAGNAPSMPLIVPLQPAVAKEK